MFKILARSTFITFSVMALSVYPPASAQTSGRMEMGSYISSTNGAEKFTLASSGIAAPINISSHDYPGVLRVAKQLLVDINKVSNAVPLLAIDNLPASKEIVVVGTLGRNPLLDTLVVQKKLDVEGIAGRWESFLIQVVMNPFPGVERALIIAGSDKRGTIYGMYDLSAKIGVSPWYWWADVPVRSQPNIYVEPGRYTIGEPAVKYRGIFINDEAPALSGWAYEKFGGFNSKFYEHVFELILRLKGNYLWPAMWGRAFYVDDPVNPQLADEYGVVVGTSHHEPLMRAHDEWRQFGKGQWSYEKNDSVLRDFWTQGVKRMGSYESIVTIGMRGDGDEPMSQDANIALLERIVKDQRKIIGDVTGKEVKTIPQDWALYKEVQDYYDKGMRVPDDVTLLLCDDNWGNIRKLPRITDKPRSGGYGIYYHYDYVGGPRNYKWLNTNQIARVWEQMHMAYSYGAKQIWIVNVGDIKPMEFPIEFFLDYAWNPDQWPADRLSEYTKRWSERQFGEKYAKDIADILTKYTTFNARRKPELLSPDTYSLVNYREAETVVADYNMLAQKAQGIYDSLAPEYKDAFYQLVLHPTLACSNLNELYVSVGKNRLYANQGRAATNNLAEKARELFKRDSAISDFYNRVLANGKWNHMMDQTHIGYTYWQQPDKNAMPEVREIELPVAAEMGVAIEGSMSSWPKDSSEAVLPEFDPFSKQSYYVDVFNRGRVPFEYSVVAGKPWVHITPKKGKIVTEERLWVSIDWKKAPTGTQRVPISISGPNKSHCVVYTVIQNPSQSIQDKINGFVESNGYVSIDAEHYSMALGSPSITWQRIPNLGRTLSGIIPLPVIASEQSPGNNAPHLEYRLYLFAKGSVTVRTFLSPTLNFHSNQGLRYAISFDDEPLQTITINADKSNQTWERWVADNINVQVSHHAIDKPGEHVLKFWMVDPGVVLQKIVIGTSEFKPSYLGPPESFCRTEITKGSK